MNEVLEQPARAGRACGAGVALALMASLLLAWITVVRDDGSGNGFFLVVMGAGVGAFATRFRAAGMARTMLGVAAMQAAFGLAVATAPVVANVPGEAARVLAFNGVFTLLWLLSASCFRAAALRLAGRGPDNAR